MSDYLDSRSCLDSRSGECYISMLSDYPVDQRKGIAWLHCYRLDTRSREGYYIGWVTSILHSNYICLKTHVSRIAVGSRLCLRVRVLRMELRTYFEPRNNVFLLRCRLNTSVIKIGMFEVGIIYLKAAILSFPSVESKISFASNDIQHLATTLQDC
jgi:hypothetical protein